MTKTSNFYFKGINPQGQLIEQNLDAPSLALAKMELHQQGIRVLKIVKRRSCFNKAYTKIKQADICFFSRQLAILVGAGIPLFQALDVVANSQSNRNLKRFIHNIQQDIQTGLSLAEALGKFPSYFNALTCNLVHIGEQSGSLDVMLEKVAIHQEKVERIKKQLKKAATYPMTILLISLMVTLALLVVVIPQFESIFKEFGADLPWVTSLVVKASKWVQSGWYFLMGFAILGFYGFFQMKKHWPRFSLKMDELLFKLPIIGPILKKTAIARFASSLAITFAAGLPLVDALHAISAATENRLYAQGITQIRREISLGLSIHAAMEKTNLFPHLVVQMVSVGEESGSLDAVLNKVAKYYEEEVDNSMALVNQLLEPLIMSILGILVGGLVIAMYLPIFKLGSIV